jgi:hypothetical protein
MAEPRPPSSEPRPASEDGPPPPPPPEPDDGEDYGEDHGEVPGGWAGAGPFEPGPSVAVAREVDRRLRTGILVAVGGVVLLSLFTPLAFWDTLGISVFHLLLPALALAQLPLLRATRLERIPVYLGSAATILVIGTAGLLLGLRLEGWEGLGLRFLPIGPLILWTLGLTSAGLLVILATLPLDARDAARGGGRAGAAGAGAAGEAARGVGGGGEGDAAAAEAAGARDDALDVLAELLPRTRAEKRAFVGLSFAAGIGEELAYRGYALLSLQLLGMGPWAAAAISSVAFGFLHAYQGRVGIVRTGGMGFLLAVSVLLTGSLFPAILAHTLIDLIGGLVLGPRLRRPLVEPTASR